MRAEGTAILPTVVAGDVLRTSNDSSCAISLLNLMPSSFPLLPKAAIICFAHLFVTEQNC